MEPVLEGERKKKRERKRERAAREGEREKEGRKKEPENPPPKKKLFPSPPPQETMETRTKELPAFEALYDPTETTVSRVLEDARERLGWEPASELKR